MRKNFIQLLFLLLTALLFGCNLSPTSMMSGYFEKVRDSIASQEDPELVRQGVPTLILLLDAAVAEDPDNPQLLLTASTIYATYAQAFVLSNGEEERAAIQYSRAKDYAMKLLKQRACFAKSVDGPFEDFEKALLEFRESDVPDLYAAGNAWLGWILSNPDSMEALSQLPKALAIMQRVLDLDEKYADGGAHTVFGIYYAVQPKGAGHNIEKSRKHFQRAMELAGKSNLIPQVTFAEFYTTAVGDHKLFEDKLTQVIESSKDKNKDRRYSLINAVARERAKKLLKRKEDFFDIE
jgi:tetratricopeptide (TPR) repeat protein